MNLSTGNEIVDKIGQINISGNIIPKIWFSTITKKDSNKPYYLAILILADIVYWYRPTEVRDETTGSLIGFKKRFKSDLLQRSYAAFEKEFGENEQVIRRALSRLEELGLIKRVLKFTRQYLLESTFGLKRCNPSCSQPLSKSNKTSKLISPTYRKLTLI